MSTGNVKKKCRECGNPCKSNQKALQCDACEEWLHASCSNVSAERYNLIIQLNELVAEDEDDDSPWYCKFCNKKVSEMSKVVGIMDKKIEKMTEDILEIKSDVVDIKAELNNKCDTDTVKQLVSSEIKTLTNDIDEKKVMEIVKSEAHKLKEPNNADIGSNIREMEDRNARKGNFMIFNAPEIESNLKNDVEKSNSQIANKILKLCGASEEVTVDQTIRLGAKGGNTRPILVKLKNLDEKRVLFKNFEAKMKTCIDKSIKGSKINHDLTKLQKTEETKLYNEAKEREKEDGKKYKVRGPSWDRKVVEVTH